jgi:hypothetical protein
MERVKHPSGTCQTKIVTLWRTGSQEPAADSTSSELKGCIRRQVTFWPEPRVPADGIHPGAERELIMPSIVGRGR